MSFASLPYELRTHIWSLAAEPRRITKVRTQKSDLSFSKKQRQRGNDILYETTSTPPPAIMHVYHESRHHAPYQRAFTAGTEPRWTWINFDLDIFCVTSLYQIEDIVSHRSEVQRLRIRTDDDHDWYDAATIFGQLNILHEFESLRDIQVVLGAYAIMWADVYTEWQFSIYAGGNITFVSEANGLVLTGPQLQLVADWGWIFSFDKEGNPPDLDNLSEQIEFALDDTHLTLAQMHAMD